MQYSNSKEFLPVTRLYISNHSIRKEKIEDAVIIEKPFSIFLNDREIITILCSPEYPGELAVGYLYTDRYITGKKDILRIDVDYKTCIVRVNTIKLADPVEDLRQSRFIKPDCTNPVSFRSVSDAVICQKVESELKIKATNLVTLVNQFGSMSKLFQETGGAHSAAVCTEDKVLFLSEDIGRHNAIDKVIGWCILQDISMQDKIILTSGRTSSAVCLKIVKAGVPILVSRSAPSSESVKLCEMFGITLIGFARGRRMNIYTHPERLLLLDIPGYS